MNTSPTVPLRSAAPSVQSSPVVLMVDDDQMVLFMMEAMLEGSGYTILSAASGEEALALVEGPAALKIDLLLTDLCMSGMSGIELASALRLRLPQLKVLYSSGHIVEEMIAMGANPADSTCLTKPFRVGGLIQAIEEALAKAPCVP